MDPRNEMVRIDDAGVAHPLGKTASQRMRTRKGAFRLMPAPMHVVFMRYVGEDGHRDDEDGAIVRLAGEVTAPGAICDIMALVAQAGWRGELVVLDAERSRSIFFEGGNVLLATSTAEGERIGDVMYKLGALTREQVEDVAQKATPERRFGETAVALGHVGRDRMFQLMGKQTEEIVYASLLVADGMFYFLDGYEDSRLASRHHVNANALLMEGVRRMDEVKYFRERIPSDAHVPVQTKGRAGGKDPSPELAAALEACDGHRSVAEVGRVCGLAEFEAIHAIFQLLQGGLVQITSPSPTTPQAIVAIFNDVVRAISAAATKHGTVDALNQHLASFATGTGIYDALFSDAGPAADGSLDPDRIATNVVTLAGPDQALTTLSQWLYEYAAFALFDAGSELDDAEEQALSQQVRDRLTLLAPKGALA